LVFETNASTNSAIRANLFGFAKVEFKSSNPKYSLRNFKNILIFWAFSQVINNLYFKQ